jgi:glutathione S-transferase
MTLTLLASPASPFARYARAVLLETGQSDVAVRDVRASPMGGEDALNAANPSGKIPALLREGARALHDSRVIVRFLDARAGAGLFGAGAATWDVQTLESNAVAIMDAAVTITYERRLRPEALWWPDWFDAQWAKIARSLDALEAGEPLLEGPLDAAQIALGCALGYLDLRHGDRAWRDGRPGLARWEATFAACPAMAATAPE